MGGVGGIFSIQALHGSLLGPFALKPFLEAPGGVDDGDDLVRV